MAPVLELADFYKQTQSKTRAPDSLKRGEEYKIKEFYRVNSKFADKDQKKPIKLVATFEQWKLVWCVFLPKSFDDMDETSVDELNDKIKAKENVRLVYYGRAGNEKLVKVLKHGEVVDQEQVNGLLELEQMNNLSPEKRSRPDDKDDYSTKAIKLE